MKPKTFDECSPAVIGEIIWLHKSGWSNTAISNRLNVELMAVNTALSGKDGGK